MQIYFHSRLCSYLSRVPILVEGTVCIYICVYIYIYIYRALDSFFPLVALVPNFLSWSHEHMIWSQFFLFIFLYNIWLINACWWTFMIVYSYMVTKVFNIQPFFFISIICDLYFVNRNSSFLFCAFTFKFTILVSRFTRKDNCLFCLYLYTFHFLRLKQKMDSLLFLIKKHNNNKTVGYNDKLAYITFINKNE